MGDKVVVRFPTAAWPLRNTRALRTNARVSAQRPAPRHAARAGTPRTGHALIALAAHPRERTSEASGAATRAPVRAQPVLTDESID
jgi:hypothetical protein